MEKFYYSVSIPVPVRKDFTYFSQEKIQSGSRVKVSEICPGRTKTNFGNVAFDDKAKAKKFMSGFTLLEPRDIVDGIIFALPAGFILYVYF